MIWNDNLIESKKNKEQNMIEIIFYPDVFSDKP